MKVPMLKLMAFGVLLGFTACSGNKTNESAENTDSANTANQSATDSLSSGYVNLSTGEKITLTKEGSAGSGAGASSATSGSESGSGMYIYADTRKPIDADMLFVDVSTGDTLYGPSGVVVNNALINSGGTWKLDETKIERDGDEIKVKSDTEKLKMDDDEMKLKTGDSKIKADEDESKTKTSTSKEKVDDDGETKVKPK